uniref:Uncharacterized protein n=1 Tax=Trichogramma kaykai TaxID=54128 RepID=A0ABD2WHM1_9HYME
MRVYIYPRDRGKLSLERVLIYAAAAACESTSEQIDNATMSSSQREKPLDVTQPIRKHFSLINCSDECHHCTRRESYGGNCINHYYIPRASRREKFKSVCLVRIMRWWRHMYYNIYGAL